MRITDINEENHLVTFLACWLSGMVLADSFAIVSLETSLMVMEIALGKRYNPWNLYLSLERPISAVGLSSSKGVRGGR